jgi:hypothetical protein
VVLGVSLEGVCILFEFCVYFLQLTFFEEILHGGFGIPEVRVLFNVLEAWHVLADVLNHAYE